MEQKKSRLLRLTLMGGQARVFICDTTEMAQQARDIHNASNTCSAAMGRMLAATAIMGANLKSEGDRITATINGGGPAGPICAIAGPDGTVKVTIEHPEVELPLKENGKLNVGGALGKDGQLTVMRSFGFGEPYVGRVALVSGEIAEDFAMYYLESEQTPSLCALGTLVGENIIASGGILIQAMPDCSEELLDALEIRAELFSSISQLLSEMTLEEIVATARERGLDAVCITDHDSMGLKETAERYSRETGFPIFVGVEYFSLWGDITAFGIDRFPDKRIPAQDFVDQVNAAGGFCVACHPFRNNNRGFEDHLWEIQGLHGVEVLNGSTDMEANRKALSICKARNMQMVGASDAHWTSQLGKYATMVPGEPKDLEEFVAALHKGGLKPAIYEEGKGYRIVDTF